MPDEALCRFVIFQIGFNKCATRSISHFFKRHKKTTADWMRGELAKSLKRDVAEGHLPLRDWPDVDVFSDMEYVHRVHMIEGFRYFRELSQAYKEALFILNTRRVDDWIRSRDAHGEGAYTEAYRAYYGYETKAQVFERWRREWYRHHADVLDYFSGERTHKLFVWDIDEPDFDGLQERVPFALNRDRWPHRGRT